MFRAAAVAGISKLNADKIVAGEITNIDFQMKTIEQILLNEKARIQNADTQIFEATEVIYEAIDKQIDLLISKTDYPCKHLFQIGAIFINGDKDMGSFCSYKRFEYLDLITKERRDLMDEF